MKKAKIFLAAGLVLAGLPAFLPAGARADDADLRAVNNRLDRLERALDDMAGGGSSAGTVSGGGGAVSADTQSRLVEIEEQMRVLTGRIEELSHRIEQTGRDLQTYKADTDMRFQDLGTAGAASAPAAPAGSAPADLSPAAAAEKPAEAASPAEAAPTVTLPTGTTQVQYDFAIDLLKRGQFPEARDALKQFLAEHPSDPLAGNAQYWLGETYYVQGQYKDAADAFLKGYTTYAKSSKAPDSLLKLGMTLSQLGQKDAACATYGQLKQQFPHASPAIVARGKLERQKAGC